MRYVPAVTNALADGFSLHRLARPQDDDVDALRGALRLLFLGLLVDSGEVDRAIALATDGARERRGK